MSTLAVRTVIHRIGHPLKLDWADGGLSSGVVFAFVRVGWCETARALRSCSSNQRQERSLRGEWNGLQVTAVYSVSDTEVDMDVATTTLAERIARALAGLDHSANADGAEASASSSVDETWTAYLGHADAVLRTIREPSGTMSAAGDLRVWATMVDVAISESEAL
jgi:hypothetical protein